MTDAGWAREKPTEVGWYWHRVDKNWHTYVVHVYQLQGALFVEFPDKAKPLIMVAGEWLGPIAPTDRAQGRVEGLREAADFVDTHELIDPSGHSSREQLKIYDVLVKASDGIRKLALQRGRGGKG